MSFLTEFILLCIGITGKVSMLASSPLFLKVQTTTPACRVVAIHMGGGIVVYTACFNKKSTGCAVLSVLVGDLQYISSTLLHDPFYYGHSICQFIGPHPKRGSFLGSAGAGERIPGQLQPAREKHSIMNCVQYIT